MFKVRSVVRSIQWKLVFHNAKKPLREVNILRSFCMAIIKAAILPCRFHNLRHEFTSRLVQASVDLYKVQKLMPQR
jgi:integrase